MDFKSTSNGDIQSAACARLLAAVIASAVSDASVPAPHFRKATKSNKDKLDEFNRNRDTALEFLFGQHSRFPQFAELIGLDADILRAGLLGDHPLPNDSPFPEHKRAALRGHHAAWKSQQYAYQGAMQ